MIVAKMEKITKGKISEVEFKQECYFLYFTISNSQSVKKIRIQNKLEICPEIIKVNFYKQIKQKDETNVKEISNSKIEDVRDNEREKENVKENVKE